jgi:hypothetical protein
VRLSGIPLLFYPLDVLEIGTLCQLLLECNISTVLVVESPDELFLGLLPSQLVAVNVHFGAVHLVYFVIRSGGARFGAVITAVRPLVQTLQAWHTVQSVVLLFHALQLELDLLDLVDEFFVSFVSMS